MAFIKKNRKITFCFIACFLLTGFFSVNAASIGEIKDFNIDASYDISNRSKVSAVLVTVSDKLYFYVDNSWWEEFAPSQKEEMRNKLSDLSKEFDQKIYPTITANYGPEWKPGVDNDNRITVLFHPMRMGAGGYFNSGNEYSKYEVPTSNEREMVYMNSDYISSYLIKGFLAHEFTHLATFNQKEKMQGIEEEVWLNEARAEYASTLCGYDNNYTTSNLRRRVVEFLKNPSDSLTNWQGLSSDYGALNLFTQYLVDYYGVKILNDSLHSNKKGIESLNYALIKNGYKENISDIFTNWTIAALVNNCSLGNKYCYKNENLKNVRVFPEDNFLPVDLGANLYLNYPIKNWTGYWTRISGGKDTLTVEFDGSGEGDFEVPYLICDKADKCLIDFLPLSAENNGKVMISDFDKEYSSLTLIISAHNNGSSYYFSVKAGSSLDNNSDSELINKLLLKIESLKEQIASVMEKIEYYKNNPGAKTNYCLKIENDLYFGMMNNSEVSCLQNYLKDKESNIYPEGLVTGNFLSMTRNAVVRFQEKYFDEILKPLGLSRGTGYVGEKTKEKINQLLK